MFIAIESSDFVNSTKMSEQTYSLAIACLKSELLAHSKRYNTSFEIFRGDAFQVLYNEAEHAFKAAILTKLKLLYAIENTPIHVSQALIFGEQKVCDSSISENMGEVAIQSGRLLDKTKGGALNIALKQEDDELKVRAQDATSGAHDRNAAISLIQALLNHHLASMTQKQAEVVYHYINENFSDQQSIADMLGMTRQNVAAHLKRGGATLFKQSIEFYEKHLPCHEIQH